MNAIMNCKVYTGNRKFFYDRKLSVLILLYSLKSYNILFY